MILNLNKIVSNAIFLAVTFPLAFYLSELIQSLMALYQFLYGLGILFGLILIEELYGGPFYHKWENRFSRNFSFAERWFLIIILFVPFFILSYFFLLFHAMLFVSTRILSTGFRPLRDAPNSTIEYLSIFAVSLPIAMIVLSFHFAFVVQGLVTFELYTTGVLIYSFSMLFSLSFAYLSIYFKPNKQNLEEFTETSYIQNSKLSSSELSQIHEYLKTKRS